MQLHRIWMIRNYTLTFAAVTLRVYQLLLMTVAPTMDFSDIYTASAWTALVGNVLVSEYFIVQSVRTAAVRLPSRQAAR